MRGNRCVLIALNVALLQAVLAAQGSSYWLVTKVTGRWEYRVGVEKPRVLTGQYEPVFPAGEVRCLEPDLQQCELRYLVNPRSAVTERLAVRLAVRGQWVSLRGLKPPPLPVFPSMSSELATTFTRTTRPGGSRAASGCGGNITLKAPVCGENIDLVNFTVRWRDIDTGTLTVLVERADGPASLFRGSAPAADGQFATPALEAFLRKLQSESDPVDVTLRVMAEGGKTAVRLVRIPPSSRTDQYEARVEALNPVRGSAAIATRMSLALEEGMWSRAAEYAAELATAAAASAQVLELAAVGLCRSDFDMEKALVRKRLPGSRFDTLCGAEGPAVSTSVVPPAGTPPPAAPVVMPEATNAVAGSTTGAVTPSTRLGVALLIGNSDYWSLRLGSVKSDLQAMSASLQSVGFAVTTKENLRTPRQFVEALEDVLRKESATPDDVLLVYYSGHGLQLDGKSHLLSTGVSASARAAEDLRDNAQSTEDLLAQMERAIPGTRVLIVEACRDNVLSSASAGKRGERGGFAFQQDDVANTFVMFANKPGLTTPVRSDYGLMGPFTEALVYALETSTGDILDVYATASKKTEEISPGQEPVMYHSKTLGRVVLKRDSSSGGDRRAINLLNGSEALYQARAWDEFRATVTRAKALASENALQQRLANEAEFAQLASEADRAEGQGMWTDAAASWQRASNLFPAREWVLMKAAVAYLMADDLSLGVRALAALSAQADNGVTTQAKMMLGELTREFPTIEAHARKATEEAVKVTDNVEFEKIPNEE